MSENQLAENLGIDASLYPRTWRTSYGHETTCDLATRIRNQRANTCATLAQLFRQMRTLVAYKRMLDGKRGRK